VIAEQKEAAADSDEDDGAGAGVGAGETLALFGQGTINEDSSVDATISSSSAAAAAAAASTDANATTVSLVATESFSANQFGTLQRGRQGDLHEQRRLKKLDQQAREKLEAEEATVAAEAAVWRLLSA
jgi:hypothetical protein